jgi:hypothetical protein
MNSLIEQQAYLDKRKYGGNKDGEVDSDDDKKYANDPDIMNKTPISKKKMIEAKEISQIKKLGPC